MKHVIHGSKIWPDRKNLPSLWGSVIKNLQCYSPSTIELYHVLMSRDVAHYHDTSKTPKCNISKTKGRGRLYRT